MVESSLSRSTGSVVLQVNALELLARYSMYSGRATSVLSSLYEFRTKEVDKASGKQWNWKYLRDQFDQKDLEGLYRKYDDKLRETLIVIYVTLLAIYSTIHIALVVISTYTEQVQWRSTYLSLAMYILRIAVPALCLCKTLYDALKKKWFWIPMVVTFVITVDLVLTDISVPIFSSFEGISLRPAYANMCLLSVYIFLPMRNNFMAIILGVLVSVVYVLIYALFTYEDTPQIGVVAIFEMEKGIVIVVAAPDTPYQSIVIWTLLRASLSNMQDIPTYPEIGPTRSHYGKPLSINNLYDEDKDVIYLIGVNLMGVYFRLMNEIVTRRSFLDRRACVESTLQLKFVKDQEERLMLSILPEHIISRVRHDIRNMFLGIRSRTLSQSMRSLNQRYVEEHENVSILYADVVNYTMISTTLAPMRMIELLNELFGRFDEASEEHDVLRIKFLGDCYYCVSGVPKPSAQHAKNCVDLGLEMIHIIKDVREKRALNIDMRIGVHSGKILSGLIGIRKWQYDIWSKDVTIANKMESTGKAGKVHVTKQTLELLLDHAREYIIEPNFESQNDPFIQKHKLETYLLSRPPRAPIEYKPYRRVSVGLNRIIQKNTRRSDMRSSMNFRRTTSFMDDNLVEYQQMIKAADAQMAKEIEDMTNGKDHFIKGAALNNITLMYKNVSLEKSFLAVPDPLFKYYILCCLIILSLMTLINGLTTNWLEGFPWYTWAIFTLLFLGLIILQPLTWFQFLWTKYKGYEEPRNHFLRTIYDISAKIIKSAMIRTSIYLIIGTGLATTSVINVIACTEVEVESSSDVVLSNCVSSWHVTQCWGLALLLNFLFSRVFFILKWIIAVGMTMIYLWVVWEIKTSLFAIDATWNVGMDPRIAHTLSVVFITLTLYWIDRTTEYRNRLDHLWQIQLSEEQKEAETMLKVNNMLLENILPAHVVQIYLDLNRPIDELYYEKYDNVAVMFASLTDYKLGVEEDAEFSDQFLLRILDEVISDFDRLLLMGTSVHKVEKIKMAGWTYMAACGLDPNRRESFDSTSFSSIADNRHNSAYNKAIVLTMVEFAAAMMLQLQNFNRGSFQRFEGINLRIGISNGEVAAGVVGSLKPLYDIWGNAVNMASRMDSTGESGKIQVTENTAMTLDECGILTTNRGETFVKGAGYIKTYYVPLDDQFNLIKKENSIDFYRTQDRNRYYNLRNAMLYDNYFNSIEDSSPLKTYDARDLSINEDFEDDFEDDIRTSLSTDEIKTDVLSDQRASTLSEDSMASDQEVVETRC